jgi:hypothetical protein
MCRPDRVKAHLVHVGHARNVPLADVIVERRQWGTPCVGRNRWVEQVRHARHRGGVPVGDWTVCRRRSRRIGHPRNHGSIQVCVGDGRLRAGRRRARDRRAAPTNDITLNTALVHAPPPTEHLKPWSHIEHHGAQGI